MEGRITDRFASMHIFPLALVAPASGRRLPQAGLAAQHNPSTPPARPTLMLLVQLARIWGSSWATNESERDQFLRDGLAGQTKAG
jgi:hypothetical protein